MATLPAVAPLAEFAKFQRRSRKTIGNDSANRKALNAVDEVPLMKG
ncbi:hypothetical protein KR100_09210 [Synechococcus sp. KORDI-100]|nr:hypothetical protein [Synechococcus sp. KORDI-100]AII43536.1 hypothetical protein KR100_09210 [Synechococcus sp. KORDI-100]